MKVPVILAHPSPGSFNHAIAAAVSQEIHALGHEPLLHDLYAEGFDPLLPAGEIPRDAPLPKPVEQHCRELRECGGIVIVHPNWWGQPPAILKGWVDRVIRPGVAYEFLEDDSGEGVPRGLLSGRKAAVFNTSNTPREREEEVFGDPLGLLWKNCIFSLCGIGDVRRRMFGVVVTSTAGERERWLEEARMTARELFPAGRGGDD